MCWQVGHQTSNHIHHRFIRAGGTLFTPLGCLEHSNNVIRPPDMILFDTQLYLLYRGYRRPPIWQKQFDSLIAFPPQINPAAHDLLIYMPSRYHVTRRSPYIYITWNFVALVLLIPWTLLTRYCDVVNERATNTVLPSWSLSCRRGRTTGRNYCLSDLWWSIKAMHSVSNMLWGQTG